MAIREEAKCRCEVPEPRGISDCLGAIQCAKCKRIANWREWEVETDGRPL